MKILLTGANGYIGKRLLPLLIQKGHFVYCAVRDLDRYTPPDSLKESLEVIQLDLLNPHSFNNIPLEVDVVYYLVHSMSAGTDFYTLEEKSAQNFKEALSKKSVRQVIFLGGIANDKSLSRHLESRLNVERILASGNYHLTALRAGIIIGSGSASFEIIRDLVEKLPVMIAPKWLKTKCQPIAIRDVITLLYGVAGNPKYYSQTYDIGGPDVLTYKEMLLIYAKVRKLWRKIYTVPLMTPRLSSYWLYFVTSTSYQLAVALVNSMKVEVVANENKLIKELGIQPLDYKTALEKAFEKIESNAIVSSWKDSLISGTKNFKVSDFVQVPSYGCFKDVREKTFEDRASTIDRIWSIGGTTGWYYADFLWKMRGFMDKLVGGVGLRRGRTNVMDLKAGDAVDFWRVLYADKEEGRLLLLAEMKLPGEAWLEFNVCDGKVRQEATFRPRGVLGRFYWYSVYLFHEFVFQGMIDEIAG